MSKTLKMELIRLTEKERLHGVGLPIVAITGGIATGKSTVSNLFKKSGFVVINADELIHKIYQLEDTISFVNGLCPNAVKENSIDFVVLREKFFNDNSLKTQLESFLYQKLPGEFVSSIPKGTEVVFYDVPLLFEKALNDKVDQIIVVSANKETQLERLAQRDKSSSKDTNEKIISQQWPLSKKEALADFVIFNNKSLEELKAEVAIISSKLFS